MMKEQSYTQLYHRQQHLTLALDSLPSPTQGTTKARLLDSVVDGSHNNDHASTNRASKFGSLCLWAVPIIFLALPILILLSIFISSSASSVKTLVDDQAIRQIEISAVLKSTHRRISRRGVGARPSSFQNQSLSSASLTTNTVPSASPAVLSSDSIMRYNRVEDLLAGIFYLNLDQSNDRRRHISNALELLLRREGREEEGESLRSLMSFVTRHPAVSSPSLIQSSSLPLSNRDGNGDGDDHGDDDRINSIATVSHSGLINRTAVYQMLTMFNMSKTVEMSGKRDNQPNGSRETEREKKKRKQQAEKRVENEINSLIDKLLDNDYHNRPQELAIVLSHVQIWQRIVSFADATRTTDTALPSNCTQCQKAYLVIEDDVVWGTSQLFLKQLKRIIQMTDLALSGWSSLSFVSSFSSSSSSATRPFDYIALNVPWMAPYSPKSFGSSTSLRLSLLQHQGLRFPITHNQEMHRTDAPGQRALGDTIIQHSSVPSTEAISQYKTQLHKITERQFAQQKKADRMMGKLNRGRGQQSVQSHLDEFDSYGQDVGPVDTSQIELLDLVQLGSNGGWPHVFYSSATAYLLTPAGAAKLLEIMHRAGIHRAIDMFMIDSINNKMRLSSQHESIRLAEDLRLQAYAVQIPDTRPIVWHANMFNSTRTRSLAT